MVLISVKLDRLSSTSPLNIGEKIPKSQSIQTTTTPMKRMSAANTTISEKNHNKLSLNL